MPPDRHPLPGVGVAVISKGHILLVKRGHPPSKDLWAIPGGKVEYGETMQQAAGREVLEETGIECEVGPVIWVGDSIGPGDPPEHHITLVDFVALLDSRRRPRAADDAQEARWVTFQEARELPLTNTMSGLLDNVAVYVETGEGAIPTVEGGELA